MGWPRWSKEEDRVLTLAFFQGWSQKAIANRFLPHRTLYAIEDRITYLKLRDPAAAERRNRLRAFNQASLARHRVSP